MKRAHDADGELVGFVDINFYEDDDITDGFADIDFGEDDVGVDVIAAPSAAPITAAPEKYQLLPNGFVEIDFDDTGAGVAVAQTELKECRVKTGGCGQHFLAEMFQKERKCGIIDECKWCFACRTKKAARRKKRKKDQLAQMDDTMAICSQCEKIVQKDRMMVRHDGKLATTCIACEKSVSKSALEAWGRTKDELREQKHRHIRNNGASCKRCNCFFVTVGEQVQKIEIVEGRLVYNGVAYDVPTFLAEHIDELELVILDFDHLPEHTKTKRVSGMPRGLLGKESDICQLVCCKCHVVITRERQVAARGTTPRPYVPPSVIDRVKMVNDRKIALGGCCICHELNMDYIEWIHFDHINPSTKISNISAMILRNTVPELLSETEECRPLCMFCHRLHTRLQFERGEVMHKKKKVAPAVVYEHEPRATTGVCHITFAKDRGTTVGLTGRITINATENYMRFTYVDHGTPEETMAVAKAWLAGIKLANPKKKKEMTKK